ncbi:hypothetical protein BKA56DRAFT_578191 [Ilyonectria sp. MPI-CAGE-AT-0026]|nr:hypothetical protein BKA56DRAFT_578191 [Ilyonectria sp. MPI-CAGE-AT-0026]
MAPSTCRILIITPPSMFYSAQPSRKQGLDLFPRWDAHISRCVRVFPPASLRGAWFVHIVISRWNAQPSSRSASSPVEPLPTCSIPSGSQLITATSKSSNKIPPVRSDPFHGTPPARVQEVEACPSPETCLTALSFWVMIIAINHERLPGARRPPRP